MIVRDFTGYRKKFVQLTRRFGEDFDVLPEDEFDEETEEGNGADKEAEEDIGETYQEPLALDGVLFGYYSREDAVEVSMKWYKSAPSIGVLEADSGSWSVLAANPELIRRLADADETGMRSDDFCAMLETCGFVDASDDDELID